MKLFIRGILLLVLLPAALQAQTPITEAELTAVRADSLIAFFNRPGTTRLTGDAHLPAGSDVGDIAILGGELTLGARVTGSVIVVNGSIRFEAGARVDGDVHVIGD